MTAASDLFEMIARIMPPPSIRAAALASSSPSPAVRTAALPVIDDARETAGVALRPAINAEGWQIESFLTSERGHDPGIVPEEALTFIENEEDGSPTYYARHYEHFEWPQGASGPTIGIGYDCGYVTVKEAIADWTGIVPDDVVTAICRAVGLRGEAAEIFVRAHGGTVTITWDQAIAQFKSREVPKWLARCKAALPNFDELPPLCQGSLLSATYNRGSGGYDDPSPRYAEMRAIKADMAEKKFDRIPMQLLSMRRLWPRGKDLWNRRTHEAALFQKGLTANGGVTTLAGAA